MSNVWHGIPKLERIHVVEIDSKGKMEEIYNWPILARSKPYERAARPRKRYGILALICGSSAFLTVWGGIQIGAWIASQPLQATVWIILLSALGALVSGAWLLCTWKR